MKGFRTFVPGATALLLALGCQEAPKAVPAVSPQGPARLQVLPDKATLTTGQAFDFKARALDGSTPAVTWEAKGAGSIDAAGHYTAPAAEGAYEIQARAFGGRVAAAQVRVVPPPHGPITASDPIIAGARGQKASVPAQAGAAYAWTLEGGLLTGDPSGREVTFNAGQGKTLTLGCQVTNAAGLSMKTSLEIPLLPGVTLALTRHAVVMTAGTSRTFGFTLAGGHTGQVDWSVDEKDGGAVDANGKYMAPQAPGTYTVRVASREQPGVQDALSVKVVPPPSGEIFGTRKVAAGAKGVRAEVAQQPGCTFAWKIAGGTLTGDATGAVVTYDAGDGPSLRLTCLVTNEAGDTFETSQDVVVAQGN